MHYLRRHSWPGIVLAALALTTLLLAGMAAVSHAGPAQQQQHQTSQHNDDCCDHQTPADTTDDCCSSSACSCACHAPLPMTLQVPPTPEIHHAYALEPRLELPSVYLAIFVPPQNLS